MKNLEIYNPFNKHEYYILEQNKTQYFCFNDYKLEISKNGYVPKSGLLFEEVLLENECMNKKVLDLGCGYLGILSIMAHSKGARLIDAIDYDDNCVKWFSKIVSDNGIDRINVYKSDYFNNVKGKKYDIILSNPPQMPMLDGSLHDSGGIDGRKYIIKILWEAYEFLKENGLLYLLSFDFLGVDYRTNDEPSLMELSREIGYSSSKVVYEIDKKIKNGSVTNNSLPYINKIYPLYDFNANDDKKCMIKILRLER